MAASSGLRSTPTRKHSLLNGLDDIGLTMVKGAQIADFEQKAKAARPGCKDQGKPAATEPGTADLKKNHPTG